MGTTRSFYIILNRGITIEAIRRGLRLVEENLDKKQKNKEGTFKNMWQRFDHKAEAKLSKEFFHLFSKTSKVAIAYRKDAPWLPLFATKMCEDYCASTKDTDYLSFVFSSPLVAFSVFDSDVLFLSYSDYHQGVSLNLAKPNGEGYAEYDMELYDNDFPAFLVPHCNHCDSNELIDVWESQEYTFADDRMYDICKLLGADLLYDEEKIPEGYELLFASSECQRTNTKALSFQPEIQQTKTVWITAIIKSDLLDKSKDLDVIDLPMDQDELSKFLEKYPDIKIFDLLDQRNIRKSIFEKHHCRILDILCLDYSIVELNAFLIAVSKLDEPDFEKIVVQLLQIKREKGGITKSDMQKILAVTDF